MAGSGKLVTLTADGNTDWFRMRGAFTVSATGDFGSGTAKVQRRNSLSEAKDIPEATGTAAYMKKIDLEEWVEMEVRVNLASSTSPDLDIEFFGKVVEHMAS